MQFLKAKESNKTRILEFC